MRKLEQYDKYLEENKEYYNLAVTKKVPWALSVNDITTANPYDTANTFNNYFTSIAKKTLSSLTNITLS